VTPTRSIVALVALVALAALAALAGCKTPPSPTVRQTVTPPLEDSASALASAPPVALAPTALGPDEPLREGLVSFEGMVMPTKGGYDVRGVTLDVTHFAERLAPPPGAPTSWPLGIRVKVVADLVSLGNAQGPGDDEGFQRRAGDDFRARPLIAVELLAPAERVEGKVERSKGFFSVGGKLVHRRDQDSSSGSLGSNYEGREVILWGQSETVPCAPNAQCLIQGELPLFKVAHAQLK
jgi:hypothetical protein